MLNLDGVFAPIPTTFDPDENLALGKLQDNLTALSRFGLAGFLVLGSNGEKVNLSDSEKIEVFAAARKAIPDDKLFLAGSGEQSTRETINLTQAAAKAGADAAVVLNPSYFKGSMTREALVGHYRAVADASPIPVIVYNMPACSGLDMGAEVIVDISKHKNIVGIKDSGGNIVKMGDVLRSTGPGFQFLAGSAGFLLPALSIGASGGILALANIAPEQCLAIHRSFRGGDLEKAREIQARMMPVMAAVTNVGGVPALKAAMDHIGLYGGPARRPMLPIAEEAKRRLVSLLDEYEIKL